MGYTKSVETQFTEQLGIEVMEVKIAVRPKNDVHMYECIDENMEEWYVIQIGNGPLMPEIESWSHALRMFKWAVKHEEFEGAQKCS